MDIPCPAHWFVESMDGVRLGMNPGETSFGEDQNTRQVTVNAAPSGMILDPEPLF
jgi:hypothetical protein